MAKDSANFKSPLSPISTRVSAAVSGVREAVTPVAADVAAKVAFVFRLVSLITVVLTLGLACTIAIATASSVAAMSAAATTRMWLLRGAPQGHILPLAFDFDEWHHSGRAAALVHVADAAPHCTHSDASAFEVGLSEGEAAAHRWQACEGHFSPIAFKGGPGAFTVSLLLELPDHTADAGMITGRIEVHGMRPARKERTASSDGTNMSEADMAVPTSTAAADESFVVARGVGSAPVRKQSAWLHLIRSALFLPMRLAGAEVNTQLVEVPLLRGFAPPESIARAITHANVTLSTSRSLPEMQVYGARLALDVELRGWTTYYLQRYPMRSFTLLFGVFFCMFFGTATSVASVLVCGTVVWLDLGRLAVAFVTWSFGAKHRSRDGERPSNAGAQQSGRRPPTPSESAQAERSRGSRFEFLPVTASRSVGSKPPLPPRDKPRTPPVAPLDVARVPRSDGPPTGGREPRREADTTDSGDAATATGPARGDASRGGAAATSAAPAPRVAAASSDDGGAQAPALESPAVPTAPSPQVEAQSVRRRTRGQRRSKKTEVTTLET